MSVAAASLLLASCGGSSESGTGESSSNTVDKGVQAGVNDALTWSTTAATATTAAAATTVAPAKYPTSMDEWNALWSKERDAMVKRITDGKFGLSADGKTIVGPEGFKVDVSKCPAGWNNVEGISDTEI